MHPAYSVILFTTASGAGYGLLVWLVLFSLAGAIPPERWLGVTGFAAAFALVTLGLLSSAAHLGRPERAWRAFSQWRTSWLSREGVLASATYVPAGLYAIGWVFFETVSGLWALAGVLAVVMTLATIACTGMIYASLKTIRQWHHPLVVPAYLAMALATGAAIFMLIISLFDYPTRTASIIALVAFGTAAAVKLAYWRGIDADTGAYTAGQATGLGGYGSVRPLDPPHSRPNFVMREKGYRIARKHARRLRAVCLLSGFVVPALMAALAIAAPPALLPVLAGLAILGAGAGVLIERWLFFAEAEHVVMLFYGAQRA